MTVSVQDTLFRHVGNGVTTSFAYNCQVLQPNDLFVYVDGAEVTSGITKNGIGNLTGGTVVFSVAPANGAAIILEREVALERTTDYQQNGDFLARVVNPDFNRIWMAIQQTATNVLGALRFPKEDIDPVGELPLAADRVDKLLSFDSLGNPVVVAPSAGTATALSLLLASPVGSDFVGLLQSGTGAVARTAQDKFRERVSVKDFGAVGDGVTDDLAKINLAIAYVKLVHGVLVFPRGTYRVSAAPNFGGTDNVEYQGESATIYCTGAGPVLKIDAGVYPAYNDNINLLGTWILKGNATSTYGLYTRGHIRSNVGNVRVLDVATAAWRFEWSVLVRYQQLTISSELDTFTVSPTTGLILAASGVVRTTACIFDNIIIEAPVDDGMDLVGADLNLFNAGVVESVDRGIIIRSGSLRNHFVNFDTEGNATIDVVDLSQGTQYTNCSFSSAASVGNVLLDTTSASTVFNGGFIGKLLQNSTEFGAVQLNDVKFPNDVGQGIQGTGAYRTNGNCQKINITVSPIAIPTETVDTGEFTPSLVGSTLAGTQVYSVRKGYYQRMGRMVHFQVYIALTSSVGATGTALLTGLPFLSLNVTNVMSEHLFTTNSGVTFSGARNRLVANLGAGVTSCVLLESTSGASVQGLPAGSFGAGEYYVSGTYLSN